MLSKDDDARRDRLRKLRVARRFRSATEAAEAMGVPASSYRSHENGQRPINEEAAMLYAEAYKANYEWLYNGAGDRDVAQQETVKPNASATLLLPQVSNRLLPVRGRAQGGDGGAVVLDGSIIDHLPGPSSLDSVNDAYGVEIIGDSMEPRYFAREIVWVHPGRGVHGGDFAVMHVRQPNGDLHAYVKKYIGRRSGRIIAYQYNPQGEISFDEEDVEQIDLIVASGIR